MSWPYLKAAYKAYVGDGTQKFVLISLANEATPDGYAFSSLGHLCKLTDFSRPTIVSAIKSLITKGFLITADKKNIPDWYKKSMKYKSNNSCYKIILEIQVGDQNNSPLVNNINQLINLTSKDALLDTVDNSSQPVKLLNQSLVKELNPYHIYPKKEIYMQKDPVDNFKKNFVLTDDLFTWGASYQAGGWTKEQMYKHHKDFLLKHENEGVDNPEQAFKIAVSRNYANVKKK